MPETLPIVSVIMPCYNYGRFLADSLDGIIAQQFQDWECILVDDGSTDDTAEVGKAYVKTDARFRYQYQSNAGVCAARNTGLKSVRGKFIQFLDSDDSIAPEKLRLQLDYLEAHPDADLVYGDAQYFNESIQQLHANRTDHPQRSTHLRATACGGDLLPMLCVENIMEISAPLFRTTLMERVGMFDTAFKSFEDWHYWFRCSLAGACLHYWPEPGTETYIRYGHPSLMSDQLQMNASGSQFRKYMQPYFRGRLAWYNRYRRLRLALKNVLLRLNR